MPKYAYQRSGHPILNWNRSMPFQSRAADAVSLGSLEGPTLVLPRPGAPEPINELANYSKKPCAGCGAQEPLSGGVVDTIANLSMPAKIAGALGVYLAYKHFKKRR